MCVLGPGSVNKAHMKRNSFIWFCFFQWLLSSGTYLFSSTQVTPAIWRFSQIQPVVCSTNSSMCLWHGQSCDLQSPSHEASFVRRESSKCITDLLGSPDWSQGMLEKMLSWFCGLLGSAIKFHLEAPTIGLRVKNHPTQDYLGIFSCHNNHTWCTNSSRDSHKSLLGDPLHSYF